MLIPSNLVSTVKTSIPSSPAIAQVSLKYLDELGLIKSGGTTQIKLCIIIRFTLFCRPVNLFFLEMLDYPRYSDYWRTSAKDKQGKYYYR